MQQNNISFSAIKHGIASSRDAIKYPLLIMLGNGILDMLSGAFTLSTCVDYGTSMIVLPITIMIYDMIPPHIATNYTWFTNPGMRRIIKMLIFSVIAVGIMFAIQYIFTSCAPDASDGIEYAAHCVGQAADSVKFLP